VNIVLRGTGAPFILALIALGLTLKFRGSAGE
jgi:hypothetical protein